ncbi:hypothetical protein [Ethanoligenens harbinense]|uniref:Uncharacterized protein n=1 Tax=Ethanoligenens harbinense (strain DSM 18485 / JCM 12961 / CGMCC 1.5033 / YUAN-3) TaxID=663278 RepID=E6U919_ETHHY|nr:hypothetical protein [Ethanoligenens harbinense]ADU26083.1 hypothetical protein Ethha_0498 [Ethanoligenens harbinense YUAN-3]AVQ95226.1 hypothetical protein CXQ68_02585 [Ethanoligenens harbinense YUAN-3]AYF37917.1 hypothetical protein CXP51_02600 [Ethanoligenens harbinense]AYF40637.1 hypothetical protein CN246_02585 [Ethanoligenens harbinense]QCN91471.1 hypothetical protein DRA42_02595 [Ethanoligenens harbinense]
MLQFEESDKTFIRRNLENADALLSGSSLGNVLDALFDLIEEKGYAPPHYYDYNDFGRKAQRVYDSVYYLNTQK